MGKRESPEAKGAEMSEVAKSYVTDGTSLFVQLPADNQWGFSIHDDDQEWPGGFGIFDNRKWWTVKLEDVPAEIRERLDWVLAGEF